MSELTLIERADMAKFTMGAAPSPLIPQDFNSVMLFADLMVQSGMAPKDYDLPKCTVAILHGMEVGLTPMAALQSIAVVNGRPTLWGDGMIALVRSSGLCEYVREWHEGSGDDLKAVCETKRKGERDPVTRDFSVADAKQAGLWTTEKVVTRQGKNGPYTKENDSPWYRYGKRMLTFRARGFALRDTYADVLKGLRMKEEEDDREMQERQDSQEYRAPVDLAPKLRAGRGRGKVIEHEDSSVGEAVQSEEPEGEASRVPEPAAGSPGAMADVPTFAGRDDENRGDGSEANLPVAETGATDLVADLPDDSGEGPQERAPAVLNDKAAEPAAAAKPATANEEKPAPAADGLPAGKWNDRERKLLLNIQKALSKATNASEVRDAHDSYREMIGIKGPDFQAAAQGMIDEAGAKFRPRSR